MQYEQHLRKFQQFCDKRNVNYLEATVKDGITYLAEYYDTGVKYSAMNTARSALSTLIPTSTGTFGEHPVVCRLLKGTFNSRPSLPRYTTTWDVGSMLTFIESMGPLEGNGLKYVTLRSTMLLCITVGQRDEYLKYISLDNIRFEENGDMWIYVPVLLKTSKPGRHYPPILFKPYTNPQICVIKHIRHYIDRTKELRKNKNYLFLSHVKPHKPVTITTISRWCTEMMQMAGIDVNIFASHSTRSAAASSMRQRGLSLKQICKAGGWSNAKTFHKFCSKLIV